MNMPAARPVLLSLAAGFLGAAIAAFAGIPAGALIGATIATGILAAMGFALAVPDILRNLAFATIGVSLGSGVDANLMDQLVEWGASLAVLVLLLIATIMTGRLILVRFFEFDRDTATLASSPGTLSNAIAIAVDGRGDPTAVMVLQVVRLLVLVIAVPPAAALLDSTALPVGTEAYVMSPLVLLGLLAVAMLAGLVGIKIGIPAACILAGMIISAGSHAAGIVTGQAPAWVIFIAFAITGTALGTRLSKISRDQIKRFAGAAAATILVALFLSFGFAGITGWLTGIPYGQVWIAYAPGGVEAMVAISLALDFDPTYVAIHHFVRILALVLILPVFLGRSSARG